MKHGIRFIFTLVMALALATGVPAYAGNDPVADAGPDQEVLAGSLVTLDGSGSYDPKGDPLTYSWAFSSVPPGSAAALSDPAAVNPTFVADIDGQYVADLVVSTKNKASLPDSVTVTAYSEGSPDPTFGTNGVVIYDSGRNDFGSSLAIQSDGMILATGAKSNGANNDLALWRFNADGTPDTSFGSGGITTHDGGGEDGGQSVVLQPDGKALVAGTIHNGTDRALALLRFNTDGTPDTGFGTSGVATYSGTRNASGVSIALQPDGRVLVLGQQRNLSDNSFDFVLVRFNPGGTLDLSFGTDGAIVYSGEFQDFSKDVALQGDGKILVTGASEAGGHQRIVLLRYNTDGSPDISFGTNGIAIFDNGYTSVSEGIALQADGRVLVTGYSFNGIDYDLVLLRFNADGTLDTSFGTNGLVTYSGGYGDDAGRSVALQANGRLLVSGYSYSGSDNDLVVLRFNPDGTLDTTYGTDGMAFYDSGYNDGSSAVVLQPDGKSLVVGSIYSGGPFESNYSDLLLMRFR